MIGGMAEHFDVLVVGSGSSGGVLAALVDLTADWALVSKMGRPAPTIDMRVDYHRAAMPGDLTAKGRIVKYGSQFSVCEAQIFDKDGQLVASGRGTYFTAPPPPPKPAAA